MISERTKEGLKSAVSQGKKLGMPKGTIQQFTGLTHCQARTMNKLEYHWNCALTAINVAKVKH